MDDLLRRAWDALDSFKQAYPENWNEDDEQVMKDLMRADLQLSGVKLKWKEPTFDEQVLIAYASNGDVFKAVDITCATLKEMNYGQKS